MDPNITAKILNKFQVYSYIYDLCFLRFESIFNIFNAKEIDSILHLCELTKESALDLDKTIVSKSQLINPYKFNISRSRFIRVTPELWKSFSAMNKKLGAELSEKLIIDSGYRSPAYQSMIFIKEYYFNDYDLAKTMTIIKRPGESEHQKLSGLAIDISREKNPELGDNVYNWLAKEAGGFGFTNSYPKDSTLTIFEPWHWRYTLN